MRRSLPLNPTCSVPLSHCALLAQEDISLSSSRRILLGSTSACQLSLNDLLRSAKASGASGRGALHVRYVGAPELILSNANGWHVDKERMATLFDTIWHHLIIDTPVRHAPWYATKCAGFDLNGRIWQPEGGPGGGMVTGGPWQERAPADTDQEHVGDSWA